MEEVLGPGKDGRRLVHAARVDADQALTLNRNVGQVLPADCVLAVAAAENLENRNGAGGGHGRRRAEAAAFGDGAADEDEDALRRGDRRGASVGLQVLQDALGAGNEVGGPVVILGEREVGAVAREVDLEAGRRELAREVAQNKRRLALCIRRGEVCALERRVRVGRCESDEDVALDSGGEDREAAVVDVLSCSRAEVCVRESLSRLALIGNPLAPLLPGVGASPRDRRRG